MCMLQMALHKHTILHGGELHGLCNRLQINQQSTIQQRNTSVSKCMMPYKYGENVWMKMKNWGVSKIVDYERFLKEVSLEARLENFKCRHRKDQRIPKFSWFSSCHSLWSKEGRFNIWQGWLNTLVPQHSTTIRSVKLVECRLVWVPNTFPSIRNNLKVFN